MSDVPLRIVMTNDVSDFVTGSTDAQKVAAELREAVRALGEVWQDTARKLTLRISLPITGLGIAATKVAADFESAMNRVEISTGAVGDQLKELSALAVSIGRDTTLGSTEAADAMDMLAKAGMQADTILRGGAAATVALAEATGSQLEPAAAAVTDIMAQFGKTASDLPDVVNRITGAVNESKLDFADFQLAMGQAGGVAGGLGVTFEDFATVLAATSSMFASGSDAGTSFKTFLSSLTPKSTAAAKAIEQYGLSFYDAAGNVRGMAEIAEQLRQKLGGLSDAAKTDVLSKIFGSDAMRTAIGLMQQGGAGLDDVRQKIEAVDASAQAAIYMKGLNGQLEQLRGAFEALAIAVANSGIIQMVTAVVTKLADFVARLAETHPGLLRAAVLVAGFAAALGPLMAIVGTLASVLLPMFLVGLSPIGLAISALINPLATAIGLLGRFALQMGGLQALGALAPMLLRIVGPIGLVVGAFMLFRDDVMPVLRRLGEQLNETLGPALRDMFEALKGAAAALGSAFAQMMAGPMGQALSWLITKVGELLAALLELGGTAVIRVLTALVKVTTDAFGAIEASIRTVISLVRGDFTEALEHARRVGAHMAMMPVHAAEALRGGGAPLPAITGLGPDIPKPAGGTAPATGAIVVPTKAAAEAARKAKAANDKMLADQKRFVDDFRRLEGDLYPGLRARREFDENLAAIDRAAKQGLVSASDAEGLRKALREQFELAAPEAADGFTKAFGEALKTKLGTGLVGIDLSGMVESATAAAEKLKEKLDEPFRKAAEFGRSLTDNLAQGVIYSGNIGDALVNSFKAAAAEALSSGLMKMLFGEGTRANSGLLGGVFSGIGSLFGGARADGGPVAAGRAYLVGERGPEMLVPRGAGTIIPNHQLGGGTTINVDARGASDPHAVGQAVAAAVRIAGAQTDARFAAAGRVRLQRSFGA